MLYEDGVPIEMFFDKLTEHDERIHQHKIGDSSGQQTWEKLTVLIAVRAWKDYWLPRKTAITVSSDNMSALALAAKLKETGKSHLISRELALIYSASTFLPRSVEHLPGISNVAADALSRIYDPSGKYVIPAELRHLQPTPLPLRAESYYHTLATA